MLDPLDFEKRPLLNRLQRLRRLAWASLLWERLAHAFWRAVFWVMAFVSLWLLQIPAILGDAGNGLALLIFFGGLAVFLYQGLRRFKSPEPDTIDRRLEEAGGLQHRPLAYLQDRLANPEKEPTRSLWKRGKDTAFQTIRALRIPRPRNFIASQDPYAVRIFVVLLFITGMFIAGPQWKERLAYGLFPYSIQWSDRVTADNIVLWITPPAYTRQPQTTYQGRGTADMRLDIPEGSIIKARIRGGLGRPYLLMGAEKQHLTPLTADENGTAQHGRVWGLETEIAADTDMLVIKQLFLPRLRIPVRYVADQPPTLALTAEAHPLPKGPLQIPLTVQDDYGVESITLRMDIDPAVTEKPIGEAYEETRAVMTPPGKAQDLKPVYDLTWHPWTGLPVVIHLSASDHKGQSVSLAEPLRLTLPERPFYNPVAHRLIEIRRELIWTPQNSPLELAYELEGMLIRPDLFDYDKISFLAIRMAASRLAYSRPDESVTSVVPLLWDTALRIEEGNLTIAARNVRDARQALEQLLSDPAATDEQIAFATEQLRNAMVEYFQELFKEMQKQMADSNALQNLTPEQFAQALNADELANFFSEMQAKATSGDRNAARQMLSQLQQVMDGLDPSMSMAMPPEMEFMMDAMRKMQALIEEQEALLEDTRQQAQAKRRQEPPAYGESLPYDPDLTENFDPTDGMPPPPQATQEQRRQSDTGTDSGTDAGIGANTASETAQDESVLPSPEDLAAQQVEPDSAQPDSAPIDTSPQQTQQEKLRTDLGQLMLETDEILKDIPQNMQNAEQSMRSAARTLGANDPDAAVPHQEEVLEQLQQGQDNMQQQMAAMMKSMSMLSFGRGPLDPLGRPLSEGDGPSLFPDSQVQIPEESERRRVQEIMRVLRERSGEMNRPDYELEYFRRLMRQF